MIDYRVVEINDSNIPLLQKMAEESKKSGEGIIERTINEWISGKNKFGKVGENFWGLMVDNEIIGIGGLNQDPYLNDPKVGRVRHVYIMKKYRGQGLSRVLLNLIINLAKKHYTTLRLATNNPIAASLYESLGFEKVDEFKVTHIIKDLNSL